MKNYIRLFVFLFASQISLQTFSQTCQEEDYIALRALYLNTDGDNWNHRTDWFTATEFESNPTMPADTDVSTWHGVTTNSEGCVIELDIYFNQLKGSIPAELDKLSNLTVLSLSNNELSGSIPAELGNLGSLTKLLLYDNELSGSIPTEFGNLSSLTKLLLHNNKLSGSIPAKLGKLDSLEYLMLYNNQLSGSIPAEIGELSNLITLSLGNNELSGSIPAELGKSNSLVELLLHDNKLNGNIPVELGQLDNLKYLVLYDNQLSGSIPAELGNLSMLVEWKLRDNRLNGCYDVALMPLCVQLASGISNAHVSNGNNFDTSWEDFCTTGAGTCDVVDIDNTTQSPFTVYPIPAKEVIIFDVPNIASADHLILYDLTGREISRQAFPQDKRLVVSHLNDGVYIYRVFYENEVYSGKIVVE